MSFVRRWLPFAALCLAAISFAALAPLLIPNHIGKASGAPKQAASSMRAGVAAGPDSADARPEAALHASHTELVNAAAALDSSRPAPPIVAALPRRGFSPALERPDSLPAYARLAPPGAFATPDQPTPPLNPADFPPLPPNSRAEIANGSEAPSPDALPLPPLDP